MDARDRDLLVPGCHRALDGQANVAERLRAPAPACRRNDAVAALLVAAGLHAQRERGAARDARFEHVAAGTIAAVKPFGCRRGPLASDLLHEFVLARVWDHARHL